MTANQLYKESGSELKFVDWLKEQQTKGVLETKEEMSNASGKATLKVGGINVKYIAIGVVAAIGIGAFMYYRRNKS
jgi:hypothetical protein